MWEKHILVFCETSRGSIAKISTEALGVGRVIADQSGALLIGLAMGKYASKIASESIQFGADHAYFAISDKLSDFQTDVFVSVIAALNRSLSPSVVIMGQTGIGQDLAPALAAYLGCAATLDCVKLALDVSTGRLMMTKPVFGGKFWAIYTTDHNPQIVTVRARVMQPLAQDRSRKGDVLRVDINTEPKSLKTTILRKIIEESADI